MALSDSTVKISTPHLYLNLSQSALPFLWLNAQALLYDVVLYDVMVLAYSPIVLVPYRLNCLSSLYDRASSLVDLKFGEYS